MLSSCETAGGGILSGEGVLGLGSAFLAAGAPAVLASLWPVDDQATAHLMDRFYRALAKGADPASALAWAQAELRRDPRWADPYFCCGFVLLGDGSRPIPVKQVGFPWVWPAGLAVAGVGVFLGRRRTKTGGA